MGLHDEDSEQKGVVMGEDMTDRIRAEALRVELRCKEKAEANTDELHRRFQTIRCPVCGAPLVGTGLACNCCGWEDTPAWAALRKLHLTADAVETNTPSPWQQVGQTVLDLRTVLYFKIRRVPAHYHGKGERACDIMCVAFRGDRGDHAEVEVWKGAPGECLDELNSAKELLRGLGS